MALKRSLGGRFRLSEAALCLCKRQTLGPEGGLVPRDKQVIKLGLAFVTFETNT